MLEVKDATIKAGERTLVRGLSFIARNGELTCVTGPSGSGKTMLLRTLIGMLPLTEGFVSVDGELLTVRSAHAFRQMMVYLPQKMQLLAHELRVPAAPECQADEYAVWNALLPSAAPESQPAELSSEDIILLAERLVESGAARQVIIADEPAAHLDTEQEQQMLALLRRQADAGKTVLIASRRPLLVNAADKVIELQTMG